MDETPPTSSSSSLSSSSSFLDLPDDCLFLILSPQLSPNSLQPGDVAAVGLTCKRLSIFVKRDGLWAEYCQHWLDTNHHALEAPPERGGERLQARQLLSSLTLPSFRSLMAGLHKLRGSPVGLWHPTKDQTQGKCESVLFVSATEPSSRSSAGFGSIPYPHLVGSLVEWNETPDGLSMKPEHKTFFSVVLGSELPPTAPELEFPLVLPSLSLMGRLKHATAASFESNAPLAASTPTAASGAMPPQPAAAPAGHAEEEETVTWEVAPALLVNTRDLDVEFSAALTFSEGGLQMTLEVIMEHSLPQQSDRLRSTRKVVPFHFRRVVGLPDDGKLLLRPSKPASSPAEGMQHESMQTILMELQGLWTAQYAIHGAEVLHVKWYTGCHQDSGQPFPLGGTRLEGRKLVGDPNVPSGEISFVVNPSSYISGRYDGVAVATGMPDERLAVSSSLAGFQVVDLHDREDICCRFSALGQINEIPGVWQPSWENAELILYSDEEGQVDLKRFSILWRPAREEEQVLQIMDFHPLKLSARPTWLSRVY